MSSRFHPQAYPPHWPALRQAVLARAAYTCECRGECGSVHPQGRCAVPHLAYIVRDPDAPACWHVVEPPASSTIRIVLAVAHLCQDSTCADLACLRGLCQRCHLRYDHAQQWRTRWRNHRAALEGAGQQCLWPTEGWGEGAPGVPDNPACVNIQQRACHPDPSSPSGGQEIHHRLARCLVAGVACLPPGSLDGQQRLEGPMAGNARGVERGRRGSLPVV